MTGERPPARPSRLWRWLRWPLGLLGLLCLLLLGPLGVLASGTLDLNTPWYRSSRASTGQAPDPALERGAVVQVYGARTVRWRGAFGIHPWIAVKRADESAYTVWQIVGWRARRGGDALDETRSTAPDAHWYGAWPELLVEHRGAAAEALINQIEAAVARYPWRGRYGLWPGPNSNTFVAWVAREVPGLRLDLPPTAIGKDYLGPTTLLAPAPSGSGWTVSLQGLAGLTIAREEGLEFNLLGLGFGVDVNDAALRLPGVGKWPRGSGAAAASSASTTPPR